MLLLTATTDTIEIVTGQACSVDAHASYMDMSNADPPVVKGSTSGRTHKNITTATTTASCVPAPAASTIRNVKSLNIRNKHATDSVTVTVQFNQNASLFELHKVTLLAGEALEFIEGIGFFVLGAQMLGYKKELASDASNSTTTAAEVTGLSLATATGNFAFRYYLRVQTSASGTAVKFAVNYDGTVTAFVYWYYAATSLATAADGVIDQTVSSTTGGLFCVEADRAKSTTALTAFVSIDTANADTLFVIDGMMVVTVAGNLELWHGSETAAATSVMAGSKLLVW